MDVTAFSLAERFIGTKEVGGMIDNPQILAFLRCDHSWPLHDEVPWCSGFVNYVCKLLRLPRSKSLRARSWLNVGVPVTRIEFAHPRYDVVILKRGGDGQPGPEELEAPGHVGFYASHDLDQVWILGGNQGGQVSIAAFPVDRILGIRRLSA